MNVASWIGRRGLLGQVAGLTLVVVLGTATVLRGQETETKTPEESNAQNSTQDSGAKAQTPTPNPDAVVVGDEEPVIVGNLPANATAEEKRAHAWQMLGDAVHETKHPETQILALASVGMLRSPEAEKLIEDAMKDPSPYVRTAAVLAAGQTKDKNLTTPLRNLLDDKEPQVVFAAAMTLWKMGDKSGEDILMSVVEGDRSTSPGLMHGTELKLNRDLHDPGKLAKLGAVQGATMLLGPFGIGISAMQFIHQSGGNAARVSAIEQLSQERTPPVHKELVDALQDKDASVRAAAAKALAEYRDPDTAKAVYVLLADQKIQVRLTAAAAYLRTTGTPGPVSTPPISSRPARAQRKLTRK